MEDFSWRYLIWAVSLGALSSVSLPIGSLVSLISRPKPKLISALAAFGAGALIAALTVELVAPTVFALHEETGNLHHGEPITAFIALFIGAVIGGLLFVSLDQLVNAHGGFLRKASTVIAYFRIAERNRQKKLVEKLSQYPLLQPILTQHVNTLLSMVRPINFSKGNEIAKEGEDADMVFFVIKGTVSVTQDGSSIEESSLDNAIGIIPILTQSPFPVTVTAHGHVGTLALSKDNFNRLLSLSSEFDKACRNLTSEQLELLERFVDARREQAKQWAREATHALKTGTQIPTAIQLRRAKKEHSGASLAIWLGILIDGIPESFVIGAGLLVLLQGKVEIIGTLEFVNVIPFTLIAGLFLSNFPEALASSTNMRMQGWNKRNIFLMWFSLMVITCIGAGFGYLVAGTLNHTWLILAEGLAAGAMLTMIASAMIPEAVHMGSASAVGLSTLAGFLAAISFKLLE